MKVTASLIGGFWELVSIAGGIVSPRTFNFESSAIECALSLGWEVVPS